MPSIETIARTIAELSQPGMKPNELFKAAQERHPKATKKEVRRAAFYALILVAQADPDKVSELHEAALRSRADKG